MENLGFSTQFKTISKFERALQTKLGDFWMLRGEHQALKLFHQMSLRVPAYKDFLKKNKVNPQNVHTIKDFLRLPTIDKNNYLRAYPLDMLCWDGKLAEGQYVISTTSGSTGEPFYFPRTKEQDLQYAAVAELYLRTNFTIHKKTTLYIDAFPMGAWIGGVFTYDAIRIIADRGYPLSIITPGVHKQEVIKAVKKMSPYFDQTIIGSYAPFMKDILDDGEREGVDWEKYNLKFIFSAEGFTEAFRDYITRKAGLKNPCLDTLNHYGTVDLGTMSYETPVAILSRRLALKDKDLYRTLFGETTKLPTFTQYFPELFYFESIDGNLLCSGFSGLPLVRYDLKDRGGIVTFNQLQQIFKSQDLDILKESQHAGIKSTVWNLPFVHVYERRDFSVSLYAFLVYPETIRRALQKRWLEKYVTGKFTMVVVYNKKQDQELQVHVEMKYGVRASKLLEEKIESALVQQLLKENSEYHETHREKGSRIRPNVVLWKYEDPTYFRPGIKQKWVQKSS